MRDELDEPSETATVAVRGLLPGVALRTPIRSGRLAGSWRAEPVARGAAITSSEEHAGPIEYGVSSRGIRAYRMVRDTLAAEERELVERLEESIAKSGKRAGFEVRS